MAKNYDEMDTEELKALAEERQQRQAALNQLARSDPSAMKAMTTNERQDFLRSQEQRRTNEWHQANAEARERRLGAIEQIAARDPGRYSATQVKAAVNWLNQNERNRRFDEEQKTARTESENKKLGMIGQGKEAAEAHAQAQLESAKLEHGYDAEHLIDGKWVTTHHQGSRERIAEQEAAAKKYLAEQGAAAQKYGIDAEHGKIGEDGKVTPGSRERTAQIQVQDQLRIEQERGKTALAQTEIQSLNAQLDRESRERVAQITASGKFNAAKVIAASRDIAALTKDVLDPTEKALIIAKYKEDNKDNPDAIAAADAIGGGQQQQQQKPKEGDRMKFDDGWATFVPGKGWVKDAQ